MTSNAPVLVVAGLGRCGTSLVMQMLHAGGMPCVPGDGFPAFEDRRTAVMGEINPVWFAGLAGKAVKVLDPHVNRIPSEVPVAVVWLDRNVREQARSQAKFLRLVAEVDVPSHYPRALAKALVRERGEAWEALPKEPALVLAFEGILASPARAAAALNAAVGGLALDEAAMAGAVRERSPECAPGLDMETSLIQQARRRFA